MNEIGWQGRWMDEVNIGVRCPICARGHLSYRMVVAVDRIGYSYTCRAYTLSGKIIGDGRDVRHTSMDYLAHLRRNLKVDVELENEFGPVSP